MPDNDSIIDFSGTGAATVAAFGGSRAVPFAADVANVLLSCGTAPTGAALIVDILVNGTSMFTAPVATVANQASVQGAAAPGIAVGDTTIFVEFTSNDEPDIKSGEVIQIDSELMRVTSTVNGSSKVDAGTPVYSITVTRAYAGTTAATHTAGTNVLPAKPRILAGATTSTGPNAGLMKYGTSNLNAGDVLTAAVTQVGSTVAGSDVSATLELVQR